MPYYLWPEEEITTRNCFNAKVLGGRVYCAKGHYLAWRTPDHRMAIATIEQHPTLYPCCKTCLDFDNDWR